MERLLVIPVMSFELEVTSAPGAGFGTVDEAQPFGEAGRIPRRSRPDAPGTPGILAEFEVTVESREQLTFAIVAACSLHGPLLAWKA